MLPSQRAAGRECRQGLQAGEQQQVPSPSLSFARQGSDALVYADIRHPGRRAEASRCVANTAAEYMEVKRRDKVGEGKAAPSSRRWVESWAGWATAWAAGWVGGRGGAANDPG